MVEMVASTSRMMGALGDLQLETGGGEARLGQRALDVNRTGPGPETGVRID